MGRQYSQKKKSQYQRGKITVKVPKTRIRRDNKIVEKKGFTYEREDVGLPGKGPKVIPIVRKGALRKHGYSIKLSTSRRREVLRKAIQDYGALSVFRKLNAMVIVRKRTQPEAREIFEDDRDWLRENYKLDGFVS
jgi:hypothetical protein